MDQDSDGLVAHQLMGYEVIEGKQGEEEERRGRGRRGGDAVEEDVVQQQEQEQEQQHREQEEARRTPRRSRGQRYGGNQLVGSPHQDYVAHQTPSTSSSSYHHLAGSGGGMHHQPYFGVGLGGADQQFHAMHHMSMAPPPLGHHGLYLPDPYQHHGYQHQVHQQHHPQLPHQPHLQYQQPHPYQHGPPPLPPLDPVGQRRRLLQRRNDPYEEQQLLLEAMPKPPTAMTSATYLVKQKAKYKDMKVDQSKAKILDKPVIKRFTRGMTEAEEEVFGQHFPNDAAKRKENAVSRVCKFCVEQWHPKEDPNYKPNSEHSVGITFPFHRYSKDTVNLPPIVLKYSVMAISQLRSYTVHLERKHRDNQEVADYLQLFEEYKREMKAAEHLEQKQLTGPSDQPTLKSFLTDFVVKPVNDVERRYLHCCFLHFAVECRLAMNFGESQPARQYVSRLIEWGHARNIPHFNQDRVAKYTLPDHKTLGVYVNIIANILKRKGLIQKGNLKSLGELYANDANKFPTPYEIYREITNFQNTNRKKGQQRRRKKNQNGNNDESYGLMGENGGDQQDDDDDGTLAIRTEPVTAKFTRDIKMDHGKMKLVEKPMVVRYTRNVTKEEAAKVREKYPGTTMKRKGKTINRVCTLCVESEILNLQQLDDQPIDSSKLPAEVIKKSLVELTQLQDLLSHVENVHGDDQDAANYVQMHKDYMDALQNVVPSGEVADEKIKPVNDAEKRYLHCCFVLFAAMSRFPINFGELPGPRRFVSNLIEWAHVRNVPISQGDLPANYTLPDHKTIAVYVGFALDILRRKGKTVGEGSKDWNIFSALDHSDYPTALELYEEITIHQANKRKRGQLKRRCNFDPNAAPLTGKRTREEASPRQTAAPPLPPIPTTNNPMVDGRYLGSHELQQSQDEEPAAYNRFHYDETEQQQQQQQQQQREENPAFL